MSAFYFQDMPDNLDVLHDMQGHRLACHCGAALECDVKPLFKATIEDLYCRYGCDIWQDVEEDKEAA